MGYDITQFINEIDMEFQCCICKMILEKPMESPCEHYFCDDCIKQWLSINATCPVDHVQLTYDRIKPLARIARNILNKLKIKCDFLPNGCAAIVRLENLKQHISSCGYNPNAVVVCDKGCSIKMLRHEYEANNCERHLADQAILEKILNKFACHIARENEDKKTAAERLDFMGLMCHKQFFEQKDFEL